jgi:tetratricopeptide (TPR) repeat protein
MKFRNFIPLMIVVVTIAAYANSFKGVFVFDDYGIEHGEQLRSLWPPWKPLAVPPNQTLSARPVASYTLAINYAISGLEVWSYHLFNLAFHLASALLLFGIVRRTLERIAKHSTSNIQRSTFNNRVVGASSRRDSGDTNNRGGDAAPTKSSFLLPPSSLAAVIALLWAVHPLTTDVVTYIIQRTDGLMGMFLLLTLYCVIRGTEGGDGKRNGALGPEGVGYALSMKNNRGGDAAPTRGQQWWFVGAVVACALGMGSKETMVVAPLVVLAYDRIFLAGSWSEILEKRSRLYAGLAATWLVLAVLVATDPHGESAGFHFDDLTPWNYLLTQAGVIVHYLRLAFFPHPLTLDYWDWPVAKSVTEILPQGFFVCALLGATAWALWKKPALGFLGIWFFFILAPTSSILPLHGEAVALRRMYLPLAAVIALVVIGAETFARRFGSRPRVLNIALGAVAAALVAVLAVMTVNRNRDFQSKIAIWERNAEARPNNVRALVNLGNGYNEAGLTERAIAKFREALAKNPHFAAAHNNLAAALLTQEKFEEAAGHFREAIRIQQAMPKESKNLANAHFNLGKALAAMKREEEAIAEFRNAIRVNPEMALAYDALGVLLERRGNFRTAAELHASAARMEPTRAEFQFHLGVARAKLGEWREAVAAYREALRLKPDYVEARVNLGIALHDSGDDAGAVDAFRAALRSAPEDAEANHNLAVVLVQRGEENAAMGHFFAAAKSHAAAGRVEQAMDSAKRALELAKKTGQRELVEQIESLLKSLKPPAKGG